MLSYINFSDLIPNMMIIKAVPKNNIAIGSLRYLWIRQFIHDDSYKRIGPISIIYHNAITIIKHFSYEPQARTLNQFNINQTTYLSKFHIKTYAWNLLSFLDLICPLHIEQNASSTGYSYRDLIEHHWAFACHFSR